MTDLPIAEKLVREWPISVNSPHLGSRPVNPNGPEALAIIEAHHRGRTAKRTHAAYLRATTAINLARGVK